MFNLFQSKKDKNSISQYPSIMHLNNALDFLSRISTVRPDFIYIKIAIEEICHAISKANGEINPDIKENLIKQGYWYWEV